MLYSREMYGIVLCHRIALPPTSNSSSRSSSSSSRSHCIVSVSRTPSNKPTWRRPAATPGAVVRPHERLWRWQGPSWQRWMWTSWLVARPICPHSSLKDLSFAVGSDIFDIGSGCKFCCSCFLEVKTQMQTFPCFQSDFFLFLRQFQNHRWRESSDTDPNLYQFHRITGKD